jgi:DNA-binding transcriptional regulator YiaG
VAQKLGVDVDSVCRWEVGYRHPKTCLIPRIIDFLGYAPYTPAPTVGEWLMMARRAVGLSRKRLAKGLGVDEGTVLRWETARKQPARHLIARLKTILAAGDKPPSLARVA